MIVDVWLEITMQCNLHCTFCYNEFQADADSTRRRALAPPGFEQILARLAAQTEIRNLTLAGGEPVAARGFAEIVPRARERCRSLILATNGTLLDGALVEGLIAAGVDTFQISILGGSAATHDAQAGQLGSFQKMLAGALEVRRQRGQLVLVHIPAEPACSELPQVLEIAFLLGARTVIVNEVRRPVAELVGCSSVEVLANKEKFADALAHGGALAPGLGITLIVPTYLPESLVHKLNGTPAVQYQYRTGSVPMLVIDPLGRLRSCQSSGQFLGDMAEVSLERLLRAAASAPGDRGFCACETEARLLNQR